MANKRNNRNDWVFGCKDIIIKNKQRLVDHFMRMFFNRTLVMFEYDGLPEELPQRQIELLLQRNRFAVFPKDLINGKHYVMYGGLGYIPDGYYEPTKAILVNPFLKYNEILDIEKEWTNGNGKCVVIFNDSMAMGLNDYHEMFASLLAENIISLRYGTINARIPSLVSADNDITKDSAELFFDEIEKGEKYGIISGTAFFENLKSNDFTKGTDSTHIKELIEEQQYLNSQWWIGLGVNANFNGMKRESINESEASMGDLALLPLADDMLKARQRGIKLLNELWGTNISVKFSSAWEKLRKEITLDEKVQEAQIEEPKETSTPDSKTEEPVKEETKNDEKTD